MKVREKLNIDGREILLKGGRFSLGDQVFIKCKNLEDFLKNSESIIKETVKRRKNSFLKIMNGYFFIVDNLIIKSINDYPTVEAGEDIISDGFSTVIIPWKRNVVKRFYIFSQSEFELEGHTRFINKIPPKLCKGDNVNITIIHNYNPPRIYIGRVQQI